MIKKSQSKLTKNYKNKTANDRIATVRESQGEKGHFHTGQGKSGGKGSFSHWSRKVRGKRVIFTLVRESQGEKSHFHTGQGKSENFVKSQGRISKSQVNFFSPSGYLYSPLTLIF